MEGRVVALEADTREVKTILGRMELLLRAVDDRGRTIDDRLREVEIDLAELKGRVAQLPNAWQMLTGAGGFIGLVFLLLRFGFG
jgi:hypothetical protein